MHEGRQQFFDVDVQELLVALQLVCLRAAYFGATPAPRVAMLALGCMVANCARLAWTLRRAPDFARRDAPALAAFVAGVVRNARAPAPAAAGPFVVCAAAAAGDVARRLLLRRVAALPPRLPWTSTIVALHALPSAAGPARWLVAAAAAVFYAVGAARTVRATADALGVRALTIEAPGRR